MEGYLPRHAASRPGRHFSAVWEPCYTFPPSITPETYLVAVTLYSLQISLNPAPWNLPRMGNDLQPHWGLSQEWGMICNRIGVSSWIFDGTTLWPALWTGMFCGAYVFFVYLLTSGMGRLGAGPMKFAWIAMPFTLWEFLSPLTVFSRVLILPYRRVVKAPG